MSGQCSSTLRTESKTCLCGIWILEYYTLFLFVQLLLKGILTKCKFLLFFFLVTSEPRYRILQSCFDQYTLSAWLEPDPDAERLIRGREVYAPKNRTLQDGGPGYWIKMQRPAEEGLLVADLKLQALNPEP